MPWRRRDDSEDAPSDRSPEERERARQERAARRAGLPLPATEPGPAEPDPPPPEPEVAAGEPLEELEPPLPAPVEPEPIDSEPAVPSAEPEPVVKEPAVSRGEPAAFEPPPDPDPDPDPEPEPDPEPPEPVVYEPYTQEHVPPPAAEPPPGVLRIQPNPPAPPAAPAGALTDPTEKPSGVRRAGRPRRGRPVVTPPADVPRGPARKPRGRKRRILLALVVLLVAFVCVAGAVLYQPFAGDAGAPVRVVIPEGSSAGDIGDLLADEGVVGSGTIFTVRATISGKRDELRSGPVLLKQDMTYSDALDALSAEPKAQPLPATIKIAIPEGQSRREIAPRVAKSGLPGDYLKASARSDTRRPGGITLPKGNRSLEGLLFPATYDVPTGRGVQALVAEQIDTFRSNFAGIDLRRARQKNLTAYEALIIASMVEREARQPKERSKIAAVIYNRLSDGMPLGIDATTRYETNNWERPITAAELRRDSPYNTRTRVGLPPTPIGNPGLASIKAAARPAATKALYFVVKPNTCGEHEFSSTFEEFQADSRRYEAERNRRGGQSPSNC